jgi:ankyrin repeat protein
VSLVSDASFVRNDKQCFEVEAFREICTARLARGYTTHVAKHEIPDESRAELTPNDPADALNRAAFEGNLVIVEQLLAGGASIDGTASRQAPLVAAIEGQQWELARWLISKGANPNAAGDAGWRPLHHAVDLITDAETQNGPMPQLEQNLLSLVSFLLDHGADPSLQDEEGSSALDVARSAGGLAVVAKLEALLTR